MIPDVLKSSSKTLNKTLTSFSDILERTDLELRLEDVKVCLNTSSYGMRIFVAGSAAPVQASVERQSRCPMKAYEVAAAAYNRPKRAQERRKRGPREPQESPKRAQESPRAAGVTQEGPEEVNVNTTHVGDREQN